MKTGMDLCMSELINECSNEWINDRVCQQKYISDCFDFLSLTRTKLTLTCRNSTEYERRTKNKRTQGGISVLTCPTDIEGCRINGKRLNVMRWQLVGICCQLVVGTVVV